MTSEIVIILMVLVPLTILLIWIIMKKKPKATDITDEPQETEEEVVEEETSTEEEKTEEQDEKTQDNGIKDVVSDIKEKQPVDTVQSPTTPEEPEIIEVEEPEPPQFFKPTPLPEDIIDKVEDVKQQLEDENARKLKKLSEYSSQEIDDMTIAEIKRQMRVTELPPITKWMINFSNEYRDEQNKCNKKKAKKARQCRRAVTRDYDNQFKSEVDKKDLVFELDIIKSRSRVYNDARTKCWKAKGTDLGSFDIYFDKCEDMYPNDPKKIKQCLIANEPYYVCLKENDKTYTKKEGFTNFYTEEPNLDKFFEGLVTTDYSNYDRRMSSKNEQESYNK